MTFHHFLNCLAVAYAPTYMIYKAKMADHEPFSKCGPVIMIYIATQLVKMLMLATFVDADSDVTGGRVSLIQELLKAAISVTDLAGLHYVLYYRSKGFGNSKEMKLLVTGLGWAVGDNVLSNFLYLFNNARGTEFSWDYLHRAMGANFVLVNTLALTVLVAHLGKGHTPVEVPYTGVAVYLLAPAVIAVLTDLLSLSAMVALGLQGAAAMFVGVTGMITLGYTKASSKSS